MIKFFRQFRQQLLSENKFSKYFFYAIGEIILVVIGILIALQINNWNEDKKDRIQEQELLNQLQSEFKSNLEQLDQKIGMRNEMVSASLKLIRYLDYPETRHSDSISKYIGITVLAPTFDPIVNDINSSGRIQLLKNTRLKEKLSLWTSEIIQVTEEEQVWLNYRTNHYMPTLLKYDLYRNLVNQYWVENVLASFHLDEGTKTELSIKNSKKDVNFSEALDHSEFEHHFAQCATFMKLTNSQSLSLRKRIVEILNLIEQDLKKGYD